MSTIGLWIALLIYMLTIHGMIRYLDAKLDDQQLTELSNITTTITTPANPELQLKRLTMPSNKTRKSSMVRYKTKRNRVIIDALSDAVIDDVLRHRPLLRCQPKNDIDRLRLININHYVSRSLSTSLKSGNVSSYPRATEHQGFIRRTVVVDQKTNFIKTMRRSLPIAVKKEEDTTKSVRKSTILKTWVRYASEAVLSSIKITSVVVARELLYLSKTVHDVTIISFGHKEDPKVGEASRAFKLIKELESLKKKYIIQKNGLKVHWRHSFNEYKRST